MTQELLKHVTHVIGRDFGSTIFVDSVHGRQCDVCQRPYIVNPIRLLPDETDTRPRRPLREQRKFGAKAGNFGPNVSCDIFVTADQKRYPNYLFCSPAARSYYYIAQMDKSDTFALRRGYIISGGTKRKQPIHISRPSNDNSTEFTSHTAERPPLLATIY